MFWDRRNWQALCKACHDSHKQAQEKSGGVLRGAGTDGTPLDPAHPWNTPGGVKKLKRVVPVTAANLFCASPRN